uniref:Uncharacterized protein n=1 Tax=Arundo donax TaxID=35708 RepID=A0A0A9E6C7_ARUDO
MIRHSTMFLLIKDCLSQSEWSPPVKNRQKSDLLSLGAIVHHLMQ